MTHIILPTDDFDFSSIHLGYPNAIQGGSYFTKLFISGKPLYIQTPKSQTKQGFFKNGKKIHTDLMFSHDDNIFINWLEKLESTCQDLIYEKGDEWFQEKLEKTDIENAFTSPIKIYRSGKNYLVRTNVKINQTTNNPNIKIYNEEESSLTIEDITQDKHIISVIEIQGIKFTSRSFQIELELKQVMLLDDEIIFEKCLINKKEKEDNYINKEVILKKEETIYLDKDVTLKNEETNYIDKDVTLKNEETNYLDKEITLKKEETNYIDKDVTLKKEEITLKKEEKNIDKEVTLRKEEKNIFLDKDDFREIEPLEITDLEEEYITLKSREDVYYEIYRQARKKARVLKHQALLAFLEAKNIKKTYMLDDLEEDDSAISDLDFKNIEESLKYNLEV
jgi:hypothetical protein